MKAREREVSFIADLVGDKLNLPVEESVEFREPEGLFVGGRKVFEPDELEEMFNIVSLRREEESGKRDRHGRFDASAADWDCGSPVVDLRIRERAGSLPGALSSSGSAVGALNVVFTHDIDRATFFETTCLVKNLGVMAGGSKGKRMAWRLILQPDAVLRTVKEMIEVERGYRISSWFFMLSEPYGLSPFSARYDLSWAHARRIIDLILESGCSIGLHSGYRAMETDSYRCEAERLSYVTGLRVSGHRSHYMRFDDHRFWDQLERAGICYDFSVGYVNLIGYRSGLTGPYHPYDFTHEKSSQVVEIPQLFMERGSYLDDYNNTLNELRTCLKAAVDAGGGYVCIQFHPDNMAVNRRWLEMYRDVIEMCLELGADVSGRLPECGDSQ